jgi:hypothetical protein
MKKINKVTVTFRFTPEELVFIESCAKSCETDRSKMVRLAVEAFMTVKNKVDKYEEEQLEIAFSGGSLNE